MELLHKIEKYARELGYEFLISGSYIFIVSSMLMVWGVRVIILCQFIQTHWKTR